MHESDSADIFSKYGQGSDSNLTHFQLTGLINEILDSDDVIMKYEKLLSTKEERIIITANEILELHYYSLPKGQRDGFIKKKLRTKK